LHQQEGDSHKDQRLSRELNEPWKHHIHHGRDSEGDHRVTKKVLQNARRLAEIHFQNVRDEIQRCAESSICKGHLEWLGAPFQVVERHRFHL